MIRKSLKVLAIALVCATSANAAGAKKPTQEELAAAWAKAAAPGEKHKVLEQMAGNFDAVVKYWGPGDDKPTESKATSQNEMVLGGRYLKQTYKGDFRGQPIEGMGLVGYDNTGKKYMAIWIDSASTDVLTTEGQAETENGHAIIRATGKFTDSLTGKPGKLRTNTELVNDKTIKYELYKTRGGKESKVLEVTYTKK